MHGLSIILLVLTLLHVVVDARMNNFSQRKIKLHTGSAALKTDGQNTDTHASNATMATMFAAVFTKRSSTENERNTVRHMWQQIAEAHSSICYRFVLCESADSATSELTAELDRHGDLLILNCEEGYAQGLLTRKVIAAMTKFVNSNADTCLGRDFMMKTDDDTFVAGNRLQGRLSQWYHQYGEYSYMGVPLPEQYPIREPTHKWYEPLEVYPEETFPAAMYGGPGYILGRTLIREIVDTQIADSNVLWNEDRAVGVWVRKLEQSHSMLVNRVSIPGTNGFDWDKPVYTGRWGDYPYILAHHLDPESIQCLTQVDLANDADLRVDQCFLYRGLT